MEIYVGGWSIKGEVTHPEKGVLPMEGVTAMMKGCIEQGRPLRLLVDGRLVMLGPGAVSNAVVIEAKASVGIG
jgi:hypothetical protein